MADQKNPGSQHLNEHTGFPVPPPDLPAPQPIGERHPGVVPDRRLRGLDNRPKLEPVNNRSPYREAK